MTNDRLMWHMENWVNWMQYDNNMLGFPPKCALIASGGGSSDEEFDIMCDEIDGRCAESMSSIIDSISLPQRTAINHLWLSVKHHYPTQDLDIEEAYENINRLAEKRGLV